MLNDIEYVVAKVTPPSVLLVTMNVEPGEIEGRYRRFLGEASAELMPPDARTDADLGGHQMGNAVREVLHQLVINSLGNRNGVLADDQQLRHRQLFNFRYQDGARMLTVGWLLYAASSEDKVADCYLENLPHVTAEADVFSIDIPLLTVREALHLDSQLPKGTPSDTKGIPNKEVEAYVRLYRYLPSYVDADL